MIKSRDAGEERNGPSRRSLVEQHGLPDLLPALRCRGKSNLIDKVRLIGIFWRSSTRFIEAPKISNNMYLPFRYTYGATSSSVLF